jgi:hypothetical protein
MNGLMANQKKQTKSAAHDAGGKSASPSPRAGGEAGKAPAKSAGKPATKAGSGGHAPVAKSSAKTTTAKSATNNLGGIDTSGAASAAARLLAAGLGTRAKAGNTTAPQSALFKQIKSGASHPVDKHLNSFLDRTTPAGTKKLDQGHGRSGPQGHNQTIGGDASRINVPRRTGG